MPIVFAENFNALPVGRIDDAWPDSGSPDGMTGYVGGAAQYVNPYGNTFRAMPLHPGSGRQWTQRERDNWGWKTVTEGGRTFGRYTFPRSALSYPDEPNTLPIQHFWKGVDIPFLMKAYAQGGDAVENYLQAMVGKAFLFATSVRYHVAGPQADMLRRQLSGIAPMTQLSITIPSFKGGKAITFLVSDDQEAGMPTGRCRWQAGEGPFGASMNWAREGTFPGGFFDWMRYELDWDGSGLTFRAYQGDSLVADEYFEASFSDGVVTPILIPGFDIPWYSNLMLMTPASFSPDGTDLVPEIDDYVVAVGGDTPAIGRSMFNTRFY